MASTLGKAANSKSRSDRPGSKTVTVALLDAERQAKNSPQPLSTDRLLGTWRLRFTAPKKPAYKAGEPSGNGFYVPSMVRATLSFCEDAEQPQRLCIQNQLQIGGLKLRFTGPAKLLPKKHLLAFDFTKLQLLVGTLTLLRLPVRGRGPNGENFEKVPVGQLPFFAFFAANDSYIAARGRGGGLALWRKQP